MPLILASGSPRRRDLLQQLGVEFSVHVTNTNESRHANEAVNDFVIRLAKDKAQAAYQVLGKQHTRLAILAADTLVCQGENAFGKPRDWADAQRIWQALSDDSHQVRTAVCLLLGENAQVKHCNYVTSCTDVRFAPINHVQMQTYWASGEPQDKAGAYAIQGLASAWIKHIRGSYSNVVGLPLFEVNQLLTDIDRHWL